MGRYSQKAEVPAARTNAERLGRANPPRGSFRHHCHHMVSLVRASRSWCRSHLRAVATEFQPVFRLRPAVERWWQVHLSRATRR